MPKYISKIFLFGFLNWLIPFFASFFFYSIKTQQLLVDEMFFKSLMLIIMSLVTQIFIIIYFKNLKKLFLLNGILTGIIWILIAWTFDLLLTWRGLFHLTYIQYFQQIGIRYLIIAFNTLTIGYLLSIKSRDIPKKQVLTSERA